MSKAKIITRNVLVLSLVSFCTDISSEMLYPIMPIYLKTIGFSILLIGVLEGLAEAVAGLSKAYFGKRSDQIGKRLPFVQIGYALSAIAKPMMAVFVYPVWVFAARTLDRVGKGVRTGARDALLSDEATRETKGRIFGFHRSMDTFGAVLGPLLALIYLAYYPDNYRTLFYIAFIPGLFAIGFTCFIKEKKKTAVVEITQGRFWDFTKYWTKSPVLYRRLVAALLVFTLINSSDVFLILKLKETGLDDTHVIGIYIFYNLIYAVFAYPLGIVADRIGLKKVYIVGLILFATVYLGMAFADNLLAFIVLFFLYGVYSAATEGISKAWISNIAHKQDTATAIGTYTGLQSICTLLASSLAGLIWYYFGANTTFLITGIVMLPIIIYMLWLPFEISAEQSI